MKYEVSEVERWMVDSKDEGKKVEKRKTNN